MSERFLVCCAHLLICEREAVDVMCSSLVRKTRRQTARLCFAQRPLNHHTCPRHEDLHSFLVSETNSFICCFVDLCSEPASSFGCAK